MQRVSEEGISFGTYLWRNGATVDFLVLAKNMIKALRLRQGGDLPQDLIDHMRKIRYEYEENVGEPFPFSLDDPDALERAIDAAKTMAYLLDCTAGDTYAATLGARSEIPDDLCIRYNWDETGILAYLRLSDFAPTDDNVKLSPFYLYDEMDVEISEEEEDDWYALVEGHRAELEFLDESIREKARMLGINVSTIRNSRLDKGREENEV